MKFYIASRPTHIPRWLEARAKGVPIISTWIDDPAVAPARLYRDLATRCIKEASSADVLVLYYEHGETLKGALIEVGAALAAGKQVRCVGHRNGVIEQPDRECVPLVWRAHPNWRNCATLDEAFGVEDTFTKFGHP